MIRRHGRDHVRARKGYWRLAFFVSSGLFLGLAALVRVTGVSEVERHVYEIMTRTISPMDVRVFREITNLGNDRALLPLGVLVLLLLPIPLLRRWWLWIGVTAFAWQIDNVARAIVARGRPASPDLGFPSGHAAAAAAFFTLLAYLITRQSPPTWVRRLVIGAAVTVIAAVGVSRIVLKHHWPLDSVGGAMLGFACATGVAWWNERTALPSHHREPTWTSVRRWVYERQSALPLPFFATIFVGQPLHLGEEPFVHLMFDVVGSALILTGLVVRLWVAGSRGAAGGRPHLVTRGAYAQVRQPLGLANVSIGLGVAVLAENPLALVVIPAVCIAVARLAASWEEELLRADDGERFFDYCRDVPKWVPAFSLARLRERQRFAWRALLPEVPTSIAAGFLAIVADISADFPWLLGSLRLG